MSYHITTDSGTTDTDYVQTNFADESHAFRAVAQQFATIGAGTLTTVKFCLRKVGSPSDYFYAMIFPDNGGSPALPNSGSSPLATSNNVSASSLPTSAAQVAFTFSAPLSLSAGTKYWVVIARTGSYDSSNYAYGCGKGSYGIAGAWRNESGAVPPNGWEQDWEFNIDVQVDSGSAPVFANALLDLI